MMRPQSEIKFLNVPPYPDAVTLTERKVKHIQSSEHETSSNPSALAVSVSLSAKSLMSPFCLLELETKYLR